MPNLPKTPPDKKTSSPNNKKLIFSTILITLFVLLAGASLIYLGFWYGQRQAKIAKPEQKQEKTIPSPQSKKQPKEVPYGDEDLETDQEYQKSMQEYDDEGCTGEQCSWMTYSNQTYGFSFKYPSTVFLKETDGSNLPLIYLNTSLITIPEAYGGFLTPVEIRVDQEGTLDEKEDSDKSMYYPNTYEEKTLPSGLKGIWTKGIMQGMYDGEEIQEVILESSNGLIILNYLPNPDFSYDLFEKILATFKV